MVLLKYTLPLFIHFHFRVHAPPLPTKMILFLHILHSVVSQSDAVTVIIEAGEGFEGYTKVLTCRYAWIPPCPDLPSDPNAICTLEFCAWKKGSDNIGYIYDEGDVLYFDGYYEPSYILSSIDTNTGCDLTIQSVVQGDSGNYSCHVFTRVPSAQADSGHAELIVQALGNFQQLPLLFHKI